MIDIDGSSGEGGGQILRTSLALSLITGTPFRIRNIRANRSKPGLRRQHLTAVKAAATVGDALVEGGALNSRELWFRPGRVRGGEYSFDIGTAGSTTLVFQTVLPALLLAPEGSQLRFRGGTHNHGGPPWDFLNSVFLPVLTKMGAAVDISLVRHGFAPGGEGEWTARILPSSLTGVALHDRGGVRSRKVRALVANLPVSVAERELGAIRKQLAWPADVFEAETVEATGPGNIVMISGRFENSSELAAGFGERGIPAEKVALTALRCWREFEDSAAPVGEHLADQLLLPIALARGGSFTTVEPTLHSRTNVETIRNFLDVKYRIERSGESTWAITLD